MPKFSNHKNSTNSESRQGGNPHRSFSKKSPHKSYNDRNDRNNQRSTKESSRPSWKKNTPQKSAKSSATYSNLFKAEEPAPVEKRTVLNKDSEEMKKLREQQMALFASYDKEREREKQIKMKYMTEKKKIQFLAKEKKEKWKLQQERKDRHERLEGIRINKEEKAAAEENTGNANMDAVETKRTVPDANSEEMKRIKAEQMKFFGSCEKEKEQQRELKMKYMKPKAK